MQLDPCVTFHVGTYFSSMPAGLRMCEKDKKKKHAYATRPILLDAATLPSFMAEQKLLMLLAQNETLILWCQLGFASRHRTLYRLGA